MLEEVKFRRQVRSVAPDYARYVRENFHAVYYKKSNYNNAAGGNDGRGNIVLYPAGLRQSPLAIATLLVHEARHSNWNDPKHTACRHGFYKDKQRRGRPFKACDQKFYITNDKHEGAHGVEVKFQAWMYRHALINDAYKKEARAMAKFRLYNNFNEISVEEIESMLR